MIKTTPAPRPAPVMAGTLPAGRSQALVSRTLQLAAFVYQAVALAAFVAALFLAASWLKVPFLGAFFEQTLVFNGSVPSGDSSTWFLYDHGVRFGDRLVSVNNIPVHSAADVQRILQGFFPGETVPVGLLLSNPSRSTTLPVVLNAFPAADRTVYFVIPAIVSALFLAVGLWIFGMRRTESAGRAFSIFAASMSIGAGSFFDLYTTHVLTPVWTLGLALSGGALIDLALSFPHEFRGLARRPYLRWVGYAVALLLVLYAFTTLYDFAHPLAYVLAWRILYTFVGIASLVYILLNVYYGVTAQSPVIKTQARMILAGSLLAFGPVTAWLLISVIVSAFTAPLSSLDFSPYLFLPFVLFPLTLGYTILRFRFVRADDWIRQGALYALLSIFIVGGYAFLVTGLSVIFKTSMPAGNPFWIGGLVFVLAILLDPIRVRLQGFVDSTFFRGQRAYNESLQSFTHELTGALDLASIGRVLRHRIVASVTPDRAHIFTYDALNDQYIPVVDDDGRPSTDIHFASNSPLVQYFSREQLPLYLDGGTLPADLQPEQARLILLGARLFISLPGTDRPVGWLALGPRHSGAPYTPRDLAFLENLADQASIAIQRVQTVANLERRVQEMNALTRVSQGVNITLTFDDVLELIYAQVAQVIPTSHFYITLYNKPNDYFYNGFVVEDNDRLNSRENLPFPSNMGLVPEVIRRLRPILTQDYSRECQQHGVQNDAPGIFAWMGVPLNAGAESIGALSVGTHDPGALYARGQLDLLQAIADQTAGAIVKARLLQETEQRARQLSTLNDVTRQLTSTLELEPLLQNILQSAVSILDCEAGSLYLVDDQTRELVVRVTTGPVAREVLNHRLPPGSGIVGRAVTTASPVIENNFRQSSSWTPESEQQDGFETRAVLAIPLLVKDNVLGVIEVMNPKDGLPFVEEDLTLLTAFGGQAAVAMENARLYTLTDQELAARVEELSVMQRIDRELNASLETERAMHITLEWALRQSNAEAGLVGIIEGERLKVVAHEGYGDLFRHAAAPSMSLELPGLRAAIETGQ
ncbi:MAG TPA: GAF domain-containing protein, partial [Chloroflexota bacterium]